MTCPAPLCTVMSFVITLFDEKGYLSRRHKDTEMNENATGIVVVDCAVEVHREALMRDGIARIIHGNLDPDPPCLGASARAEFIESGGPPNAAPPRR